MAVQNTQKQAQRILQKLFSDTDKDELSREEVLDRISLGTFYNYGPMLRDYDLAITKKSGKNFRFTNLVLTDKGRQVLKKKHEPTTGRKVSSPKVLTPQELQTYVDEYNRENPSWPFELVPKGFRKEVFNQ
jgi:hypothetical protein